MLVEKLRQLTPDSRLSHYKAISLALAHSPCPDAVESLVRLLDQPGFTGHAITQPVVKRREPRGEERWDLADRYLTTADDAPANQTNLNRAYKELIIATLLYRHGDYEGRGQAILEQYTKDIHGHFARYARMVRRE